MPTPDSVTPPADCLVYVGTYAKPEADGIFGYRLDLATGALTRAFTAKAGENPSYFVFDATRRFLYAVNETQEYDHQRSGSVTACAIDPVHGGLTPLNDQPTLGGGPCYISLDRTGSIALVANYAGGSVAALPVAADGTLGGYAAFDQHAGPAKVDPDGRQNEPHAHCIVADIANRFAFAVDLGTDEILRYELDLAARAFARPSQVAYKTKPGAGPRHLVFHPNGSSPTW